MLRGPAPAMVDAVRDRRVRVADVVDASLAAHRARRSVDQRVHRRRRRPGARPRRRGSTPTGDRALPLLGVPFAVKNLFDVAGLVTRAGSKIERDAPPATRDAVAGRAARGGRRGARRRAQHGRVRLRLHDRELARRAVPQSARPDARAGRLVGRLRRGRRGRARCRSRSASDTNGSIRVPSSLCGTFGLKPTFGRLSRRGSYPFVAQPRPPRPVRAQRSATSRSPTTRCRAPIPHDPAARSVASSRRCRRSTSGVDGLRIAVLDGWFAEQRRRRRARRRRARRRGARRAAARDVRRGRGRARRGLRHHERRGRGAAPARPAHARRRLRAAVARPLPRRRAAAGGVGRAGAARAPASPPSAAARAVRRLGRAARAGHAVRRAADRHRVARDRRTARARAAASRAC